MRLFHWQFDTLVVPMMEDESGTLYTTSSVLAHALGVTENNLVYLYQAHPDEFDGARVSTTHANSFFQQNMEEFGIQRVRQDIHLWTENDMILFAALSRSDQGKEFRKQMVQLVKQQARKTLITKEQFDAIVGELMVRINELEKAQQDAQPHLNATASAAGSALAHQRYIKPFRN